MAKKVLVVDDEVEILEAMRNLLDSLGYQSIVASNGAEALDKFKRFNPEAVLMDVNMPEMDGVSCAEQIIELHPDAKIIFISGYEMEWLDDLNDRIKEYAESYLIKPVEAAELSTCLARILRS